MIQRIGRRSQGLGEEDEVGGGEYGVVKRVG